MENIENKGENYVEKYNFHYIITIDQEKFPKVTNIKFYRRNRFLIV